MKLWLIQQPLYRCCGRTNPCCKACRWSSKCPSNIHQAREGSAACKRRWNRGGRSNHFAPWPTTFSLTAAAVSSDADQARRISEDNAKKKKKESASCLNSFALLKSSALGWSWRVCGRCETCVCMWARCSCTHLPHYWHAGQCGGKSCHLPLPWQQPASHPGQAARCCNTRETRAASRCSLQYTLVKVWTELFCFLCRIQV